MEHSRSLQDRRRLGAAAPDSDVWSFDFGVDENIASSLGDHRAARKTKRRVSYPRRHRQGYSSPPPDYRSSVKDHPHADDMPVGLVPSHYNVSALYNTNPVATEAPHCPIEPSARDAAWSPTAPLARDVSVKAKPNFQKILRGWHDHNTTKRMFATRFFSKKALAPDNNVPPSSAQNGVQLQKPDLGSSPAYELSARTSTTTRVKARGAGPNIRSSAPKALQTSARGNHPQRPVDSGISLHSQDKASSASPSDDYSLRESLNAASVSSEGKATTSNPNSATSLRGTSQRSQRTILEDVPEHETEHLSQAQPRSSSKSSRLKFVMRYSALASSAFFKTLIQRAQALQEYLPLEPPIPRDHVRVRWTCQCGDRLYDDFIETSLGAADRLETELNRPRTPKQPRQHKRMHSGHLVARGHANNSPPSRSGSNGGSSIFSTASSRSSATSTGDIGDMSLSLSGGQTSGHGKPDLTTNGAQLPHLVRLGTESEVPWLLTCCAESRLAPKLTHLSMDPAAVRSDCDVALAMRDHYNTVHSGPAAFMRLRGLKSIDFVKFEVHRNRFADVRAKPHMPPFPHPSALPGYDPDRPETASWEQATDYAFEPGHLVPPVGPHYLMHLFSHPHDYETESITLRRIPKKLGGRLECGVGWGVELVDGFVPSRVWAMLCLLMLIASATFVSVWMTRGDRGDVQGAFAVAAWVVACIGVIGGWIGAMVE